MAADVCRSTDGSFGKTQTKDDKVLVFGWDCDAYVDFHVGKVGTLKLTSFNVIEVCSSVGALAVVDVLHVAGVFVRPQVQSDAVSLVRLQRLWVVKKNNRRNGLCM